jgi:hypothetical protein
MVTQYSIYVQLAKSVKIPLGKLVKHMILLEHVMNKGSEHKASLSNIKQKKTQEIS